MRSRRAFARSTTSAAWALGTGLPAVLLRKAVRQRRQRAPSHTHTHHIIHVVCTHHARPASDASSPTLWMTLGELLPLPKFGRAGTTSAERALGTGLPAALWSASASGPPATETPAPPSRPLTRSSRSSRSPLRHGRHGRSHRLGAGVAVAVDADAVAADQRPDRTERESERPFVTAASVQVRDKRPCLCKFAMKGLDKRISSRRYRAARKGPAFYHGRLCVRLRAILDHSL